MSCGQGRVASRASRSVARAAPCSPPAHTAPKDWARVEATARELGAILGDRATRRSGTSSSACCARRLGGRRARRGEARDEAVGRARDGLNGIRKTTSIYQPWFKAVLHEALGAQADAPAADKDGGLEAPTRPSCPAAPTRSSASST